MLVWLSALFLWGLYSKLYNTEYRKNFKDSMSIQQMLKCSWVKIIFVSEPPSADSGQNQIELGKGKYNWKLHRSRLNFKEVKNIA